MDELGLELGHGAAAASVELLWEGPPALLPPMPVLRQNPT
jgi:hypothetical protein